LLSPREKKPGPFAHISLEPETKGKWHIMRNTADADKWHSIKNARFRDTCYSNREKLEKVKENKRDIEEKRRKNNIQSLTKWVVFR